MFFLFFTAEAFLLCDDCYLGNREMSQSVPKQKKKAPQYKGQKKSKLWLCWLALLQLLPFLFLFLAPAVLSVKTLCSVICHAAGSLLVWQFKCRTCSLGSGVWMQESHELGSWVQITEVDAKLGQCDSEKSITFRSLQLPIMLQV